MVDDAGLDQTLSFAALARRSDQVANYLAAQGVGPGNGALIMLGNVVPLWETMLATIKLGATMIPATTLLQRTDLEDRLTRGRVHAIVADGAHTADSRIGRRSIRIAVGVVRPLARLRGRRRADSSRAV